MHQLYFYCAAIGGGILALQTLLMVFGSADADFDTDVAPDMDATDGSAATGVLVQLSLKTVVAFFTFFGLTGLACMEADLAPGTTVLYAAAAGAVAFVLVGYLMSLMVSLQSHGNVDLSQAVGQQAKVYLRIPADNQGTGKVTVLVGGRQMTKKAITLGPAIPTGASVQITAMASADTFQVAGTSSGS